MSKISGLSKNYDNHRKHEFQLSSEDVPSIISAPESIDCLRHRRMFDVHVTKLARVFPNAKWLTVGDGRFGSDGIFLKSLGIKTVHCQQLDRHNIADKQRAWLG